ncbi:MAG: flagellar biosynthetic protein FliR [Deltaproteobacteria bacterium RIFOXYA12_FULL_61_11]|nr:MAG: flagellar biosynthetic protein FliR [Deltaproteobacteria bacterium RIFOXYA12_FULL_61_11]
MFTLPFSYQDVQLFLLIAARVSSFLMLFPVLGSPEIPNRIRILLALAFTLVLFQLRRAGWVGVSQDLGVLAYFAGLEVVKGLLLGLLGRFIMSAINLATQLFGQNMGLAMANMFDPVSQQQVSVVQRLYVLFYVVIFLQLDIHHDVLRILAVSFDTMPIGPMSLSEETFNFVVAQGTKMFVVALKISAPILVTVTLSNLVLGIIVRTAPQMNIYFAVGMFGNIVLGMLILLFSLPFYLQLFRDLAWDINRSVEHLVRLLGGVA